MRARIYVVVSFVPNITVQTLAYLFDGEAVGRRGHFSKHSMTDTNALWHMHAWNFHSDGCFSTERLGGQNRAGEGRLT